ncbi:enoyl-CoA hydratase/isomerase family protein [Modestobacter excelsi]|uniref:enoyl-CoA hydratase/isomerase family protein n=1 Tax=Modestobacter excelsi TaxID=2213161 RepID=UPI00110CCDB8|nr:enoyl-CoA hydratase/isomerase family protein [Modestobacter excelsi]
MSAAGDDAAVEPAVLVRVHDGLGHLTLNRPRSINALSYEMVELMQSALDSWADDSAVRLVVIDGAGERGLCAGGDIVAIYSDARAGGTASIDYWAAEYRLDATIADYPKPVVALMDGIVMGGGVGISTHASHRIVEENSTIAMPEVGIGFVPDVGGLFLLARAPGQLGLHAALTGARMGPADAIHLGFADAFVPRGQRGELLTALSTGDVDGAIARLAVVPPPSPLAAERHWIDLAYDRDSIEEVLAALDSLSGDGPERARTILARSSPTSLKVALRSFREAAADPDLHSALVRDLRIAARCLAGHDFTEGIRAQVIDKDRNPRWRPATLAEVSAADVDAYFAPLGERDLHLDRSSPSTGARR